jgi:hypothetical protein
MSTFVRRVLFLDAATCAGMGLALTLLAEPLAPFLGLPAALLFYAGIVLLPIAAFIAWVGTREHAPAAGVWLVIAGNAAWVLGSLALFLAVSPTALGYAFVIAQALVVVALAELEYVGLRKAA